MLCLVVILQPGQYCQPWMEGKAGILSNTVQVPDTSPGELQGSRGIFLIMQGSVPGQRTMALV